MQGRVTIKTLLGLLVAAALVVAAVRIVPVYVRAYEFRDFMRVEAKLFPTRWPAKTPQALQTELQRKAASLNLPVRESEIQVTDAPGGIEISARFAVPVDLLVLQHTLSFDFRTSTAEQSR